MKGILNERNYEICDKTIQKYLFFFFLTTIPSPPLFESLESQFALFVSLFVLDLFAFFVFFFVFLTDFFFFFGFSLYSSSDKSSEM